jgi:hypothetical protein
MIPEAGTSIEFKHCLLFKVETRRCSHQHVYVVDPAFDQAWKKGWIPNVNECPECQASFEKQWDAVRVKHGVSKDDLRRGYEATVQRQRAQ